MMNPTRAAAEALYQVMQHALTTEAIFVAAVRAYALGVHVQACHEPSGNGYHGPWSYCGEDFQTGKHGKSIRLDEPWYCSVALQYLP